MDDASPRPTSPKTARARPARARPARAGLASAGSASARWARSPHHQWFRRVVTRFPITRFRCARFLVAPFLVARFLTALPLIAALVAGPAAPAHAQPSYVALGDSYSSGLGTRDYLDDDSDCYRSEHAFPSLTANRLGAALTFAACVGARIADVTNDQLARLSADTAYVSVQVGGNDAGYSDVLLACAQPWPTTCRQEIDEATDYIEHTLPSDLDGLYGEIAATAPDARVVVVGYPRLFNGEECNLAARISPGEQAELNAAADLLSETIEASATSAGFDYVDARPAFTGHAVCDDAEWINGLSNPIRESYHPNRAGQSGYTDLVEPALRD